MAWIIISIIIAFILFMFIRSYIKINSISKEATMLVAYTKYAKKGKSSIFEKEETQDAFEKKKFERLMQACYLANRFAFKTKQLRSTYHFNIIENGSKYGEVFEVQKEPFLLKIIQTLNEITASLPDSYQIQVDNYMRNPLSVQSQEITKDIEEKMYPKDKLLREYADSLRNNILEMDFLYILCRE
jgi:hypothetical protein